MVAENYKIILASNSPRRKELLAGIDVDFEVRVIQDIDESYPADIPTKDIAEYISRKKAAVYQTRMADDELIITADTIVVLDSEVMGKPHDEADASRMLHELSGRTHQVITGVTLTTTTRQQSFSVETDVTFKTLSDEEINYYVQRYKPFDKAGAYGIQEWIGHIGVTGLQGSYFNVMGLPVQRIYEALREF
jgi:septum formation protein